MYFFKESIVAFIVGGIALYAMNHFGVSFHLPIMMITWFVLTIEAFIIVNVGIRLYRVLMKKIMK